MSDPHSNPLTFKAIRESLTVDKIQQIKRILLAQEAQRRERQIERLLAQSHLPIEIEERFFFNLLEHDVEVIYCQRSYPTYE